MEEIKIATNLHCKSCITELAKVLDAEPTINHWKVDLDTPDKTVSIRGHITKQKAFSLIETAGFQVINKSINEIKGKYSDAHNSSGFWKDKNIWGRASINTLNCLIGCSIGDFAMVLFLQTVYPNTAMSIQMALSVIAGLMTSVILESSLLHIREKMDWKVAIKMAVSMSFISMVAMEIVMDTTDFLITGGKAQLGSPSYWLAFFPALVIGFLAPLPYNYYKLKKYNRSCH